MIAILCLAACGKAENQNDPPSGLSNSQVSAVHVLIDRLAGPDVAQQVQIVSLDPGATGDVYEVSVADGQITLGGSSPVAVASALNEYLRRSGQGHLSWGGDRLEPGMPPASFQPVRRVSPVQLFYNFNFTAHGYTTPYWSWNEWQREIDLMAFNGISHPLVIAGIEEVFIRTFTRFGYSREEIRDWLVLPAHLPWQLMGNMHSDGPRLSEALVSDRAELGGRITARLRSLGMQPVLPGYYGMVPDDFAQRHHDSQLPYVVNQGDWAGGYRRPPLLDPNDPVFAEVAAAYYEALEQVFGKIEYYAADPFHEGGKTEGIDVPKAAQSIQNAMLAHNADAVWVLQAWQENPKPAILASINKERSLVVDLWGDEDPAWGRDGIDSPAFDGTPWAWMIIQNFGGNTGLTGNLDILAAQFAETGVFNNPAQNGLVGLGAAMEATHQNPVVQDFLFELRWHDPAKGTIDVEAWLQNYADRRYGQANEQARLAWALLGETVYHSGQTGRQGTIESVFAARPSLDAVKASTWGPEYGPYYDEDKLEAAFVAMLEASEVFSDVETYQYDLVDLGRQVLANHGRSKLGQLKAAFEQGDAAAFNQAKQAFLGMMLNQDRLLNTRPEFRLESWLARARNTAHTAQEGLDLERNARRILTSWSPGDSDLRDYAHREWSGLVSGYYYPRWKNYLDALNQALQNNSEPELDLWALESAWIQGGPDNAIAEEGEDGPVEIARQIVQRYLNDSNMH